MARLAYLAFTFLHGVLADLPAGCVTAECFGEHDDGNLLLQRDKKIVVKEKAELLAISELAKTSKKKASRSDSSDFTPEEAATLFFTMLALLLVASFIQQRRYINTKDDVQEEGTQRSKRMAKTNMGLALAMEKDSTATVFREENIMLAARAGCALIVASMISFVPQLESWFTSMSYDVTYVGVLVLWTMGRSIGETVSGLWDAVVGTALAFLWIWMLEGVAPNGVHVSDPAERWVYGAVYFAATTLFMMFGTWRNGMRVWCLSYHMGNMMVWLQPVEDGTDDGYSHHFKIKFDGAAFGYIIVTLFAAVVTILALSLPTPRMAHRIALRDMQNSANSLDSIFRSTVKLYFGHTDNASSDLMRCKLFLTRMQEDLVGMKTQIDAAWWEHFDIGVFADIRRGMNKHVIVQQGILECIQSLHECLGGLQNTDATTKLRSQVEPSAESLVESTYELYDTCFKAMENGAIDEEEARDLIQKVGVVEADIEKLSTTFRAAAFDIAGQGFTKQQSVLKSDWQMIFLLCSTSRLIVDMAKEYASRNPRVSVSAVQAVAGFNVFSGVTDPAHLEFAFRNSLSLFACWAIGYTGVFGLLPPYTSGIATNASLLLSTSVGSALKKNMGRVQGLVLGTTVGCLLYGAVISQGCDTTMYYLLGYGMTFFLGAGSFYMFVSTKENSFIFYLFGGFASQRLLAPCASEMTETDLASYFKNILCAIVCVSILAVVDLSLTASAGKTAEAKAVGLAKDVSHCITLLMKDIEPQSAYGKIALRAEMDALEAKAIEGAAEPRLFSQPFNENLYSLLVSKNRSLLIQILTYRWAVRHSASSTLEDATAEMKKGDGKIFPIFDECKIMSSLHDDISQMLDTFICNVESQVCAKTAMDSARATMDATPCYPKVKDQIDLLREEIGPKVDALGAQKEPVDKDISTSIHVIFTVFEAYVKVLEALETESQCIL